MYDESMVGHMREELTNLGITEMKTPQEVDEFLGKPSDGTTMVVINSVCGCAAGGARPGVALALKHSKLPNRIATVFAGQDREATEKARTYFVGQPPSSPCMVLLKDKNVVFMLHRSDIERRSPEEIATQLTKAFDAHCS